MAALPPAANAASSVRLPKPRNSPSAIAQAKSALDSCQVMGRNASSNAEKDASAARKQSVESSAERSLVQSFWSNPATPQSRIGSNANASHSIENGSSRPTLKK